MRGSMTRPLFCRCRAKCRTASAPREHPSALAGLRYAWRSRSSATGRLRGFLITIRSVGSTSTDHLGSVPHVDTPTWISLGSAVAACGSWIWAILQRNTAERALATAREANVNSTHANGIATRALAVSERGAVDAQKARLVAAAPRISVSGGAVQWPPLRQADVAHSCGIPWEPDYIFRTPREESTPVGLRYTSA